MYERQRRDWTCRREMHSDEDNVEEWEWKWNGREVLNGLEKRERDVE